MKLTDLIRFYKNSYRFSQATGMSHNCWRNWEAMGYIPLKSQLKIQKLTNGLLEANLKHIKDN